MGVKVGVEVLVAVAVAVGVSVMVEVSVGVNVGVKVRVGLMASIVLRGTVKLGLAGLAGGVQAKFKNNADPDKTARVISIHIFFMKRPFKINRGFPRVF